MHLFFFFNDTATTEIYTLSLHDALPISPAQLRAQEPIRVGLGRVEAARDLERRVAEDRGVDVERRLLRADEEHAERSEEHTSELQSRQYLVCRLLLEKKKNSRYSTEINS